MGATGRLVRFSSDDRLIEQLRGGSHAAFEAIYSRHHRGVLSFCRHILGSPEEAEDAVQHTFLEAYRDLVGSAKEIRLRPWLYAIARNRCLTVLRARRERPSADVEKPSTENLAQEVERREDLRAVLGDLAALPEEQRAALLLAEMGGMSHDDISKVLGCERDRVKALVYQARSSLIASRTARETPCAEVRVQIANLRGGSLRRNTVRRHPRVCAGCRDYRDAVAAQRRALALVLPVVPTIGLQAAVLGGVGAAGTAAGAGSLVATAAVAVTLIGGGTAAVQLRGGDEPPPEPSPPPAAVAEPTATPTPEPVARPATRKERAPRRRRTREPREAPVQIVGTATPSPAPVVPAEPEPKAEPTPSPVPRQQPVTTPQPTATVPPPPQPSPTAPPEQDDDAELEDDDG